MQAVSAIIGARGLGIAVVAGGISSLALGAPLSEAVRIGAAASLAGSVGDALLSSMGYDTVFDAYNPSAGYIDLSDVVAGGAMMFGLEYLVGVPQQPALYHAAVAGLACGVGGKVASYLLAKMPSSPVPGSGAVAPTQATAPTAA
jgi:hypothetical protein